MKFSLPIWLRKSFFLFIIGLAFACENHVEEILTPPCNPEPATHTILWKMGVSGQVASVIINPGDTVKWIWDEDGMPHDVSSNDPNAPEDFGSVIMTGIGNIYEYTFTEETVFQYRCSVHPNTMFGTITVIACPDN